MDRAGNNARWRGACRLCGEGQVTPRYRLSALSVVDCHGCGAVFTTVVPDRAALEAMYAEGYFRERHTYYFENAQIRSDVEPDENTRAFGEFLDRLEARRGQGHLLDVGCWMGIFLSLARARRWQVRGVELSAFASEDARRRFALPVVTGTLRDAAFPEASFDVVTLLDVFEHLPDPRAELAELFRVLRPGGTLLLDTPNADALLRRLADRMYRWTRGALAYPVRKLYHEFHLFYYSEQILRRLLGEAGFLVEAVEGRAIPLPKARGTAVEKWIVKGLSLMERRLNGSFELVVIARRPTAAERT